jgi:RNA polymerase sigma factor (sigma-70 family)
VHAIRSAPDTEQRFAETSWSVVVAAGAETQSLAQSAMAELCRVYWPPIYGYLRRSGYNRDDAGDFTQSFFQHLLENETVRRASREKGRFRSFLIGALKQCLSDEHTRRRAAKRGGNVEFLALDAFEAEELHHLRADVEAEPDEVLDARWATVLLDRAMERVRTECATEGKNGIFDVLAPFLAGGKPEQSYQQVAAQMRVPISAVATQIHRLRRQFASAVRHEVLQTVSAPHEVEDELRQLRRVFARVAEQRPF